MARNEKKMAAALEALTESNTLTEAAERAGISRKTLYTYIREEHSFALAYQKISEEAAIRALETMDEQRERAADVIMSIMEDENQPSAIRLRAAQTIMEASTRQREKVTSITASCVSATAPLFDFNF